MEKPTLKKSVVAVIDIGASAVRMVVAEIDPQGGLHYLENLQKPIRFGRDVFTTGRISSEAVREAIAILKNFKFIIEGYGSIKTQAVATSAVRDAQNRESFLDQVFVRTGFEVEVLEGPEENRLDLIAVEHSLEGKVDLTKKNCLIIEVGSGTTELILLNEGQVEVTRTLPIGSIRLPDQAMTAKFDAALIQRVLKRTIREIADHMRQEYNFEKLDNFIALGAEMRFVVAQLRPGLEGRFGEITKKDFLTILNRVSKMTPEEISSEFGMPYPQAQALYPALLYYSHFLNETKAESLLVPMASIRDGILLEMAQLLSDAKRTDLSRQVIASAKHLGEKFRYDKAHALTVTQVALRLFDALVMDHGMGIKERLLLEVSGILHDIGTYISAAAHHKHSQYLVDASEIFGLRRSEKDIIANVVRYHRRSPPRPTHVPYMSLSKFDRVTVLKLSAILRAADALDRSHQQKIKDFVLEKTDKLYTLWVPEELGDIATERDALKQKGDMFSEVFGVPLELKQGTPR